MRHAAGVDPRNPDAQAGYAAMLRERGDIEGAITVLKTAESKSPRAAVIQYQLGLAYRDFKLRDQALAAFQKAVQVDPGFADAYPPLIAMMDEDKVSTDKIYGLLEAGITRPDDFDTADAFRSPRVAPALAAYQRAVGARPSDVEANFHSGRIRCKLRPAASTMRSRATTPCALSTTPRQRSLAHQLIEKAPPPQVVPTVTAQNNNAADAGRRPSRPRAKPKRPRRRLRARRRKKVAKAGTLSHPATRPFSTKPNSRETERPQNRSPQTGLRPP